MVGDEVTFGTVPLCKTYNLIIEHFEEEPPEPKTEVVEIPFGEDIDITDAFGEVNFSGRTQKIDFLAFCGGDEFHDLMSQIMALLHGQRSTYELSFDPGFTYQGRWRITDQDFSDKRFGRFSVEIDCDPWKIKPDREYTFNAYPAVTKIFDSGRKTVRPEVTTQQDVYVTFKGMTETFAKGTHSSANLAFTWGENTATFKCKDWWFYQQGNTLVINDPYISYDVETGTITLADEIIEAFNSPVLTLDDSKQMVTVKYLWRDI